MFFLISDLEGTPSGMFANTSLRSHPEQCLTFTSQGLSFPICRVGTLGQVNGFHLVPIKSSKEAPRFKMGNGRNVASEVGWEP